MGDDSKKKRKPLVATDFKTLADLKKELEITYIPSSFEKRWSPSEKAYDYKYTPASVTVSHSKGGLTTSNTLSEETVKQEELKKANSGSFWDKSKLAAAHPELVWHKGDLEAIDKLSFVKKNTSGTAIGKVSDAIFEHISNKPRMVRIGTGKQKLSSHDATKNMLLHVFGQAIITTLLGRAAADLAGDIHERDQDSLISGSISKSEERQAIDNYIDMVNNLYGQELGEELGAQLDADDGTDWTAELTAKYLNAVQDYFHEHKGWKFTQFKQEDTLVARFTALLNEV